jgi:hypothetical protein
MTKAAPMTRTEWLRKYPNHCHSCEARTDSANPCQECLGSLICPRCGRMANDEGEDCIHPYDAAIPCTNCGWVETEDNQHGAPLSRKDKRLLREDEAAREESDRYRRIQEARQTLKELGAE